MAPLRGSPERCCTPPFACSEANVSRGRDDSVAKGKDRLSSSPISVAGALRTRVGSQSLEDGSAEFAYDCYQVQRSVTRKRRIKRGSLSPGSDSRRTFDIAYRIYRPELLTAEDSASPLLVIHGGPSLSSDYLYPLVEHIQNRSIIYFDQLGCGSSDAPRDLDLYGISKSVGDLEEFVLHLSRSRGLRNFHLYGHSFGGILAYEYVKRAVDRTHLEAFAAVPLSVVLSNSSTSVELSNDEADRLISSLEQEHILSLSPSDAVCETLIDESFWKLHNCRLDQTPPLLESAFQNRGVEWFNGAEVGAYAATPPTKLARPLPPALIIRGTHDFVTEKCIEGWPTMFQTNDISAGRVTVQEIDGSHYLHLENPSTHGEILNSFLSQEDA